MCLIVGLAGYQVLWAQPKFEHFRLIDQTMGLPSNAVRGICKDSSGFIWFATHGGGLCRFDGSHFKTYKNDPEDSTSIFDDQCLDVAYYHGKIWVATEMGLSVLDLITEQFDHIQFDSFTVVRSPERIVGRLVTKLFVDHNDNLWIGTQANGLVRYAFKTDEFQFFPSEKLSQNVSYYFINNDFRVLSLAASKTNNSVVYAGTLRGLQELNYISGKSNWHFFPQATPFMTDAANVFRRMYFHDDGLLYSGNWSAGIHVFNPVDKSYQKLPVQDDKTMERMVHGAGASNISRKNAEEIWITTGNGISAYNTKEKRVTYWKENDLDFRKIYGIDFVDENQRAWLNVLDGVAMFDPRQQQVVSYSYKKMRPSGESYTYYILPGRTDRELIVIPKNDHAVYHFDLKTHQFERFPVRKPGSKSEMLDLALGVAKAPDGTYTLLVPQGLFSYNPTTHLVRTINIKLPTDFYNHRNLYWDSSGQLWISKVNGGMYRWNPQTGNLRYFYDEFVVEEVPNQKPAVSEVWETRFGQFWFRRMGGFSVYLPDQDSMLNFLHTTSPENTLANTNWMTEDRKGRIWITGPDGTIGYAETAHPEKGIVKKFNLREQYGLGYIYFTTVDNSDNLWGITSEVLFCLNTETLELQKLSFDYAGGDIDFFSLDFFQTGQIVIGGRTSIYLFDPAAMQRNTEMPKPYIEEIQVKGKTLPVVPLVDGRPGLNLKYWENDFSITFSAIAFTLGEKCRFRYRLRGQEEWQEPEGRRFVNYTNVPGGDYVFEVQVANNEGVWSNTTLEMPVFVATAWWATWWFRTLGILAFLALVYGIYRYRILQVKREERMRSVYEKRLANVEMSALLAQMNPHFLFNSLNSIDSYIIRNESRKASEYLNNFARLMRLILNNSRTNYISLNDELESLDLYLQMESLRFRDKFLYEIIVDENIDTEAISIPPMLIQPYVENAIWHGLMHKDSGEGKVTISVKLEDENLKFVVEDNGVGRAYSMALGAKGHGKRKQSMGMKITEDRIEIINKLYDANTRVQIIDLQDAAGNPSGTRVVLTIPI